MERKKKETAFQIDRLRLDGKTRILKKEKKKKKKKKTILKKKKKKKKRRCFVSEHVYETDPARRGLQSLQSTVPFVKPKSCCVSRLFLIVHHTYGHLCLTSLSVIRVVSNVVSRKTIHVSNHVNTRVVRKRRERKTERETEIKKRRRRMEDMRRSRVFARGVACRSRQRWIERDTRRNGTQKERE